MLDELSGGVSKAYMLHYHHVGGRGGNLPFVDTEIKIPEAFFGEIQLHLYDADDACADELVGKSFECPTSVHTMALWRESVEKPFYVNNDVFASSFLPASKKHANFYRWQPQSGDWVIKEALTAQKTALLRSTSLDELADKQGVFVDFLSLDTQGAEPDILKGATKTLGNSVVGVMAEIALLELYEGQGLFTTLTDFLKTYGFSLVTVHWNELGGYKSPIGWRSNSCPVDGDAYYIKDAVAVMRSNNPFVDLLKLAFIALTLGLLERAIEAMCEAEKLRPQQLDFDIAVAPKYVKMLFSMMEIFNRNERTYPVCLLDVIGEQSGPGSLVQKTVSERYFTKIEKEFRSTHVEHLLQLAVVDKTELENLLASHGFAEMAAIVEARRKKESAHTLALLGIQWSIQSGTITYARDLNQIMSAPYLMPNT